MCIGLFLLFSKSNLGKAAVTAVLNSHSKCGEREGRDVISFKYGNI